MKKAFIILLTLALWTNDALLAKDYDLVSPDGAVKLTIAINDNITYSVLVDGKPIMDASTLSMTVGSGTVLGQNPQVIKENKRSVNQKLYPELRVKSQEIQDNFNELELVFKGRYSVTFRAYNNGVAYRFETSHKKELIVRSERAEINFSGNNNVYFPRESEFFSHNERLYEYNSLDTLSEKDLCSLPTLVESSDKIKLLVTETGLLDYPGMWLTGATGNTLQAVFPQAGLEEKVDHKRWTDDRSIRISKEADYIAKTEGARSFPWRIVCIAKNDADLITNQLTYQLAEPSRIKDPSWIKPGKVAWDWWNYNNIYGVDFEAGVNTDTYKYYIDFASKYGIEYIILDEGWYVLGDVLNIVPEVDVKELMRYGAEKNVGIVLWVTWSSLDQKLQEALDTFKAWGAKGLKVDFMQRDDQWMVNYYERIASECAKRELIVDFHGSYKPSGLRRTYPNVLTREGVKGAENNKWASYITPQHNLTLPFIRMVAGPMDYTPGAMINAQEENFRISWNRPMSMGTRCHQLAMYAIFESPLQMLCDNPSNYLREDESTAFLAQFPTVWDDTKVLEAKIGDYVALARRSGDSWYLGAMTDEKARTIAIDLSFLEDGNYNIEIFQDGVNAERYAQDYKRVVKNITNKDVIPASLANGGGWAAIITKK
ncbi:MAG: glycoside hydrolase family 97 protein [Reichenbachiella sp.]|uniref:glycoside hydrolase family 97 protein n=1 Tax=Reichenbachiella sp. TaxID=2184521 RepID=UPI003262CFC5